MSKQSSKEPEDRKFRSFDGTEIRVTHPDGSVALVGNTPRTLPRKLWREAIKVGCQTDVGLKPTELPELTAADDAFTRMSAIKTAIAEALQSDEADPAFSDAFTANDIPNVRWLEKRVGFGLSADERDQAWAEVSAETPEEEHEGEDE